MARSIEKTQKNEKTRARTSPFPGWVSPSDYLFPQER